MAIIRFTAGEADRIEAYLNSLPDIDTMDADTLDRYRLQTAEEIGRLDALEPRNQNSDSYDQWADLHEALEDVLDEIIDIQEDLNK